MTEKTFTLQDVEPLNFYGVNNSHVNALTAHFPKLKIVVRGEEIKVQGSGANMKEFEGVLKALTEYCHKRGQLSVEMVNEVCLGANPQEEASQRIILYGNNGALIKARTPRQQQLVEQYDKCDLLFAVGPAGSGKTYTAIALAVRALKLRQVRKIILTRPAIEAGERLGFLPGDMKEKLDPYLQPLYDALHDMIPAKKLEGYMEEGIIQIAPLAFMRGRTLDNAFVILDEAQNTTLPQMKMFLTRMGKEAKFIVTGDVTQIDLPRKSDSGLQKSIDLLENIKDIAYVKFNNKDIIRHPLVSKIVNIFDRASL
ncbi:MAG: PhoH family protein [Bacteroidales bacterium]